MRSEITLPNFIYNLAITEWISFSKMTDEEKKQYPKAFVCDGYLKRFSYKEAWKILWDKTPKAERESVKSLPNFDAVIFEEITGIKIDDNSKKSELLKKADELILKAEEMRRAAEEM